MCNAWISGGNIGTLEGEIWGRRVDFNEEDMIRKKRDGKEVKRQWCHRLFGSTSGKTYWYAVKSWIEIIISLVTNIYIQIYQVPIKILLLSHQEEIFQNLLLPVEENVFINANNALYWTSSLILTLLLV